MKTKCLANILSSSYSRKCFLVSEISVFFNHQYFFNRSSSELDIWHEGRHEWKEQGLLTGFLKKILIVANEPFMAQKMVHPHNSGSAVRIFLKFSTIKGASRYMKIMFIIFSQKKGCLGKMDCFGSKNGVSSWLWSCWKNFFLNFPHWKVPIGRWW